MKQYRTALLAFVALPLAGVIQSVAAQTGEGLALGERAPIGPIGQALVSSSQFHDDRLPGMVIPSVRPCVPDASDTADDRLLPSLLGAVLGGVVGIAGAIGYAEVSDAEGWGKLGTFSVGMMIIEPFSMAVGAHLGNKTRGRLGSTLLVSYGTYLLGSRLFGSRSSGSGSGWFLVPLIQIGGTVAMELGTSRIKH